MRYRTRFGIARCSTAVKQLGVGIAKRITMKKEGKHCIFDMVFDLTGQRLL